MAQLFVRLLRALTHPMLPSEAGQSTAEYALVMIAAAAIGGLLLTWAHHTNLISGLFSSVVHKFLGFL